MMKSFFKKLAFVMALAMVVSAMAPAATAKAAEKLSICLQEDATYANKLEAYEMTEGDEPQDFKFAGAPTNWKDYTWTWTSDDETVATVNAKSGLVTVLAAGDATIKVASNDGSYVGEMALTVNPKVVKAPMAAEVTADNKVQLTFADETIKASALKGKLEFKYYVVPERAITLQLIKSITDVANKPGVVEVELYTTLTDGKSYSFVYGEEEAPFDYAVGAVADVFFKINDVAGYTVEVNDVGYTFSPIVYNEKGVDITTTAMKASGAYVEYTLSEGDAYWAITDGIQFSEAGQATVTVTYYALNANNETVAMGNSWDSVVVAKAPEPWSIDFDSTPIYTIAASAPNWDSFTANKKLAVGDTKKLFVSVTDNKNKEVRTNTVDTLTVGAFRFESTNDEVLYVTDDGTLMPNKTGTVDVLVWFKSVADGATDVLATVITVKVEAERGVRSVDATVEKNTLSTSALVDGANKTKVTVTVVDTLGDVEGVAGKAVKVEQTSTTATGLKAPDYDKTGTVGADGTFVFYVTADANSAAAGSYATYSYKITVGNSKTKTFSVTVRAPKTADAVTSYKVLVGGDIDINVVTGVTGVEDETENQKFTVSLIGLNNGVANKTLKFVGPKAGTTPSEATKDKFYYEVKKGADALTSGVALNTDGVLEITTTKGAMNDSYKQTTNASSSSLYYVKDENGAGSYSVVVWTVKYNADTKTYYWSKVTTANQTVADTEVTLSSVEKVAPTFAIGAPKNATPADVIAAVKNCFKFKVGNVELKAGAEAWANYELQVNENLVTNGNVMYVKSVTIYRIVNGAHVNCGTISVNSTIEFTEIQ